MAASAIREQMESADAKCDLTPLIDIAFLIIIFFMCLPFKTLDAKLQAYLPTDRGPNITLNPPEVVLIKVHVVGRDEAPRQWGPVGNQATVSAPTRVLYRFEDGSATDSLEAVATHIRRLRDATAQFDGIELRGEIKAAHKVPHKYVVALLNRFAEARINDVDFYGTAIPARRLRNAPSLPFPADSR